MPVTFPDGTHHDGYCAPADLEPLRAFVNTLDVDAGTDELTSPEALVRWLRTNDLFSDPDPDIGSRPSASEEDLRAAVALREALRAMLRSNNDGSRPTAAAIRVLNETSVRACMSVHFTDDGWSVCACGVPGIPGAFGRLLTIVTAAQADGTWQRLKVCPADDCALAYYDVSRNRSRRWCSMDVCGNRAKVHAFRGRVAGA